MTVDFALLAVLANGPRPESWLGQELASGRAGLPALSAGQVSPALGRLRQSGLVAADGPAAAGDPGQEFRITASGRRELAGWLRTTPDPASADDLVLKIVLACQVPGTDVHDVIQAHRRFLIESMQRRIQIKRDGGVQELRLALAEAAELARLDSVIRWLDTADGLVGWVSDADRDLAAAQLREHFAVGRLTHAELDERLTAALTAQTPGDLRGLLADLP
jgi:DNA-binding PadR family transcriptional regulator